MPRNNWSSDAPNHYNNTLCLFEDDLYQVNNVLLSLAQEEDTNEYERMRTMSYPEALRTFRYDISPFGHRNGGRVRDASFDDLRFVFPESHLVNIQHNGFSRVDFVSRYVMKQYRRGMRPDTLQTITCNRPLANKLQQNPTTMGCPSEAVIREFFLSQFYTVEQALTLLDNQPGTVAISDSIWLGTSAKPDEILVGYQQYAVGTLNAGASTVALAEEAGELRQHIQEETEFNVTIA
jgi:hypothetical protein